MKNAFAAALFCLLAIPIGTTSAQGSKSIWAKTSKTLSQLLEEGAEIKAAMQGGMGAGGAWFLLQQRHSIYQCDDEGSKTVCEILDEK